MARKKLKEKSFSFEIFVVGLVYTIPNYNFCAIKCLFKIYQRILFIHIKNHPNARLNHFDL
jgi:hypothetical protein